MIIKLNHEEIGRILGNHVGALHKIEQGTAQVIQLDVGDRGAIFATVRWGADLSAEEHANAKLVGALCDPRA